MVGRMVELGMAVEPGKEKPFTVVCRMEHQEQLVNIWAVMVGQAVRLGVME
jgi:hypothetical protein